MSAPKPELAPGDVAVFSDGFWHACWIGVVVSTSRAGVVLRTRKGLLCGLSARRIVRPWQRVDAGPRTL